MKGVTKITVFAFVVLTGLSVVANAHLVTNGNFEDGLDGWGYWAGWGGWEECDDHGGRVSLGWYDGDYPGVWQNTGAVIEADTVYTMTVIGRAAPDAAGLRLRLEHDSGEGTTVMKEQYFNFPEEDRGEGNGPWREFSMSIDTSNTEYVDFIGGDLFVSTAMVGEWWAHVGSVTVVPEPTTIALFCVGGLAVLKRRHSRSS